MGDTREAGYFHLHTFFRVRDSKTFSDATLRLAPQLRLLAWSVLALPVRYVFSK